MKLKKKYHKLGLENRLYQLDRPLIGLTGGIATGKSTVTRMLTQKGLEVIDADQLVKAIYRLPETIKCIQNNYPDAVREDKIDFPILRNLFFHEPKVKEDIETFIYQRLPKVFNSAVLKLKNQEFIIYDVPLLFEKNLDLKTDLSIVVYAPQNIQRARLMDRDGHVEDMANKILHHQMDIETKKMKADFVINNSASLEELAVEVDQLLQQIFE